jgi:hypothetical protein
MTAVEKSGHAPATDRRYSIGARMVRDEGYGNAHLLERCGIGCGHGGA